MTRPRLLALNALSMLVANIISKLVLFVGVVYLLQYLPAGLESVYYLITAFATIIAMNFHDGMISVTIRRVATEPEDGSRQLGILYLASGLLAFILALVAVVASYIYARLQLQGPGLQGEFIVSSCAFTGAYLVGYWGGAAGAGFKAYEKLYIEAILLVFQTILNTWVYIYGSTHGWPLSVFFLGLLATNTIYTGVSGLVLIRFVVKPDLVFNVREAWLLFRESLGLGYATLLRTLQDRMHPFFITTIMGIGFVTQFSSTYSLLVQLKFIPLSIRPALFPTLARKATEASDSFQKYSLALMKFLYLVALPLIILLIISRYEVLPFFTSRDPTFRKMYALALAVFPAVGWSVAMSFPSQVLRSLFIALKHPDFEFRTVLVGVISLAILNLIFIPIMGIMGAAVGALLCEMIIFFYGLWLLEKVGRGVNVITLFLLPTLCGIMTNWLAEYLYRLHWAFGIASVLILFPALILAFRVVSAHEWQILREVIKPGTNANR